MAYYSAVTLDLPPDDAEDRVREELEREGSGVLTEIDVQATLKKKLDVDFRPTKSWEPVIRHSPTRPSKRRIRSD